MRSQTILMTALIVIVLTVMGIIIFLPSSPSSFLGPNGKEDSLNPDTVSLNNQTTQGRPTTPPSIIQPSTEPSSLSSETGLPDDQIADGTFAQTSGDASAISPETVLPSTSTIPPNQSHSSTSTPGVVAGVVKDPQGRTLSGVAIQVTGKPLILTNNEGRFQIENLTEQTISLKVQLGGYQTVNRDNIPVGTSNLEIILIPEGSIAGSVLDQFGDPIALAQVHGKALQGIWAVDVNADAEGRFLFSEAPKARVRLQATQEGFTDVGAGSKEVEFPSSDSIVLRLNRPTFSISGRVIVEENQQGLGGFQLRAVLQDSGTTPADLTATTDSTGLYKFDNLRQGTYVVSSLARENASRPYVIPLKNDFKSVRLYEKSVTNIDFVAVTGRTVSGIVINTNNQPVANAEVTIAGLQSVQTQSAYDGQFRLTGVPTTGGQTLDRFVIRLQASHSEYGTGFSDPLPTESETAAITGIRITLQGLSQVSGQVVDQNGAPIGDARVVLRDTAIGQSQETRTGADGQFVFNQVAVTPESLTAFSGTHEILVEKENYTTVRKQVVLQTGQSQPITIVLEQGGFIQGRVLDPSGNPLAGVNVSTPLPQGGEVAALSDSSGMYFLNGLPEGAYDIHFRVDSDPPLTGVLYQMAVGNTGADITLQTGKWDLMGTVFNAQSGERIFQYLLSVEGAPKNPRGQHFVLNRPINTPDGTYHLTFTEPGIYRIRFIAPGYQPLEEKADIDLNTMRLQYINPQLQPTQTTGGIQGIFAPPEGIVLVGINVPGVNSFLSQGNSFLLDGIPAGNHDLIFHAREQSSAAIFEIGILPNVAVTENQTTDIGRISPQNLTVHSREF